MILSNTVKNFQVTGYQDRPYIHLSILNISIKELQTPSNTHYSLRSRNESNISKQKTVVITQSITLKYNMAKIATKQMDPRSPSDWSSLISRVNWISIKHPVCRRSCLWRFTYSSWHLQIRLHGNRGESDSCVDVHRVEAGQRESQRGPVSDDCGEVLGTDNSCILQRFRWMEVVIGWGMRKIITQQK